MVTNYRSELSELLEKQAVAGAIGRGVSSFARRAGTAAADGGALRTGLAGAGIGAAGGAVSGAGSDEGAARGALRGALLGGVAGAGTGAVARSAQNARLLNPNLTGTQTAAQVVRNMGQGVKDFGERQVHGLTGLRKSQVREAVQRRAAKAQDIQRARYNRDMSRATSGAQQTKARKALDSANSSALKKRDTELAAIDAGITSIPGIAKGLVTRPGETARAMWQRSTGGTRMGAGMAVGLPVAFTAPELLKGDESATGGKSIGQKLTNVGTAVGAGVATGGLGFIPGMVGWSALDAAGNAPFESAKKKREAAASRANTAIAGRSNPSGRAV